MSRLVLKLDQTDRSPTLILKLSKNQTDLIGNNYIKNKNRKRQISYYYHLIICSKKIHAVALCV